MPTVIDVRELPARWAEAFALVIAGGEVIVMDGATPRASLVPYNQSCARVAGLHAGAIQVTADFDAPLPDDFWMGRT